MRVSHQVPWRTLASAFVISGLVLSTNVATFADENGENAPLTVATQSDPQENPQNQVDILRRLAVEATRWDAPERLMGAH